MKSRNILDSIGYIDDDMIEDAERNFRKRGKSVWLKCVCAAVFLLLIAAAAFAVVPMFIRSEPENNGVYWVDDRPRNDNGIVAEESAIEWPWNCMEVCEQFPEISYNGAVYTSRTGYTGEDISEDLTGRKIGEGTALGYDFYENEEHYIGFEVYEIKKVDSERFVAVKYDGYDKYYVFLRHETTAAQTLGDFIGSINLSEYCKLTDVYYKPDHKDELHYALSEADGAEVWQMIAEYPDAKLLSYPENFEGQKAVSFALNSEALGAYNLSLSVYDNGYILTNIENYGYCFYIGAEGADEIINYVLAHKTDAPGEKESEFLIGTVTEIGDDYIKVDDTVMMKNPDDGIEFTVYANHTRIKRYIVSGFLKVGQTVVIEHGGIYSDEPTIVRTAMSLYEAYITGDGEAIIPE